MNKIFILVIAFLFVSQTLAQNNPSSNLLTPQQTLAIRRISDVTISPDGERVAFTVTEPVEDKDRKANIWLYNVKSRELRQFTSSPKADRMPRWSPDGHRLAFLSTRREKTQIYIMPVDGGEAIPLTESKSAVSSFEWSPDGKNIAFLAEEPQTADEEKQEKERGEARIVDKSNKLPRLWVIDVASKKVRQLTSGRWHVSEMKWSRAGDKLVVSATDRPESDEDIMRIYAINTGENADTNPTEICNPPRSFSNLKVSPDGKSFAFIASRIDGPAGHDLYLHSLAGGTPRNLTSANLDRPIDDYIWRKDGSFLAKAAIGFKTTFYEITDKGTVTAISGINTNPDAFDSNDSGLLAFAGQTATEAPELWISTRTGSAERVTNLNENFSKLPLVKPEFLRYRSFDKAEIEAALLKPRSYTEGMKVPLVVLIHGGPTGRWSERFDPWGQLLAARGYAVLYPNVRGSVGYGWNILIANRADWGGGDFKDVMAGVDEMIKRGLADPNRLGIAGWSYGGYMAMWAVTQTNRFKAAVAGAGLSDLASEFGTEEGPYYDEWFYGTPYEKLEGFIKSSPITYIKNAKTPTLILQGENDKTDPVGQSQQFYRGLKRYGVESDFVLYPREGHGIREEKHIIDVLTRLINWFDTHLRAVGGK